MTASWSVSFPFQKLELIPKPTIFLKFVVKITAVGIKSTTTRRNSRFRVEENAIFNNAVLYENGFLYYA